MAGIGLKEGLCDKALDSVKERMECEHGIVLNNPAYTTYHVEMGEISSYPEGYKECNLKNLAGQLEGHLLIIHDDHDDTCVPQHTLSFMKACVDARTYPDLFIYPCHKHNVAGRDRVHLHEKITRYFEQNL